MENVKRGMGIFPVRKLSVSEDRALDSVAFSTPVRKLKSLRPVDSPSPLPPSQMASCRTQPLWGRPCPYPRWFISMTPPTMDILLAGKGDGPAERGVGEGYCACVCARVSRLCVCMYVCIIMGLNAWQHVDW